MKKMATISLTKSMIKHINLLLNKAQTAFLTFMLLLSLSQQAQAQAGAALNFDGSNDYVAVPYNAVLNITGNITLEAWVKTSTSTEQFIISRANSSYLLAVNPGSTSPGKAAFYMHGPSPAWLYSNISIADGNWHHVACVRNGTTAQIFIDGALDATGTVGSGNITTSTDPLGIGRRSTYPTSVFNGSVDEVRIWNTARTCDQISQIRNCELVGNESGLVAYYKFNQGTAASDNTTLTSLIDATANGNNGTFSGFALNGSTSNFIATGGVTTGVSCGAVLAPEINLKGNTVSIPSGTTATSTSNHTDFGTVANGSSFARTFTIENTGTATLTVSNITSNNAKFVVSNIPPSVSTSGTATVTVTFNPTATGAQTATITVNNDDCDEGAYTFTVTGTGTGTAVLPVELLNFKATPSVSSVKLDWETANEVNNKGFYIERLIENGKWGILGFVNAKGKTSNYDFMDNTPLSINYYRLRQIDNDGKETLSKVVSASFTSKSTFKVYPNPVSNHLTLDVPSSDATDYRIFNLLGKQVLYGRTVQQIDVSVLPQGSYVIKVGAEQAKFVKQ